MENKRLKALQKDIQDVLHQHPGLSVRLQDGVPVELFGPYVVKDDHGTVQGEFHIKVILPAGYPNEFPVLAEYSNRIERSMDRHINSNGVACEEMDRLKIMDATKGITLANYFSRYVHKFLCWQLVYEEEGKENLQEWAHQEAGVQQFYLEFLQVDALHTALIFLQAVIDNCLPGRNDACICGGAKKYKHCHQPAIEDLKRIPKGQLKNDIQLLIRSKGETA